MPLDPKQTGVLFAGAIALILASVALVGFDYSETRERAATVPLIEQRISSVETTLKESAQEQTAATRELSRAVVELRETIIRLEANTQK